MDRIIISPEQMQDAECWIREMAAQLTGHNIRAVAMVALTEEDNQALCGFWRMDHKDKQDAAAYITESAVEDMVCENIRRYIEENSPE